MKNFHALINELNGKLNLPQPTKSRVLLEIASDLEDSYSFYREQGLSDREALQKADERFSIDDQTISEIEIVHRSFYSRWLESLSQRTRVNWERILLIFLTLIMILSGLYSTVHSAALHHTESYAYILIALFSAAVVLFLHKFYQFYIKKDHQINKIRKFLPALLSLSILLFIAGLFTYYLGLFMSGSYAFILETKMLSVIFPANAEFQAVMQQTINWTIRGSAIMMLSMLASIIIALLWFFLINKVLKIEKAEIAHFLTD